MSSENPKNPFPGKFKISELGRDSKTIETDIQTEADVLKAIKPHLMSRDIEWYFDPDTNIGHVYAGVRCVGKIERTGDPC